MSTKAQTLVYEYPFPPSQKLVMLALSNQCDDYGRNCFIGFPTMMRHTGLKRRTIFDVMNQLEAADFLRRVAIGSGRGRAAKVGYEINIQRLQQGDLLGNCAAAASVQQPHQCGNRTGAGTASVQEPPVNGAAAALHKAPKSTQAGARARTHARLAEFDALPAFDGQLIEPYLAGLPDSVPLTRFAAYVKHRRVKRGPMSISEWLQVAEQLRALEAAGVDLDESLRLTIAKGLCDPIDPRTRGGAPPKTRANDDFTSANYVGTPTDELPVELRS